MLALFLALLPTQHNLHSTCFCQIFLHMYTKHKIIYPLNRNNQETQLASFANGADTSGNGLHLALLSRGVLSHLLLWADHSIEKLIYLKLLKPHMANCCIVKAGNTWSDVLRNANSGSVSRTHTQNLRIVLQLCPLHNKHSVRYHWYYRTSAISRET